MDVLGAGSWLLYLGLRTNHIRPENARNTSLALLNGGGEGGVVSQPLMLSPKLPKTQIAYVSDKKCVVPRCSGRTQQWQIQDFPNGAPTPNYVYEGP